jgi:hypothetical protein
MGTLLTLDARTPAVGQQARQGLTYTLRYTERVLARP